uniref:PDZ domain-containing protein n=1 Tax=Glossina brevipalpis TaxID=37001 RepID=A0A1A9X587_9MUSC
MLQNPSSTTAAVPQPKLVVIRRRPNQGFGFTLRHFIAYPPEDDPSWPQEASEPYQVKAMETIFIKEVHPNGPAYYANLQTGDRVLMVNNTPIAGIAYSTIVSMIKQTPSELKLLVVPKECDVLQMHYTSIAHTPQSNVTTSCIPRSIPSPIVGASTSMGNGGNNTAGSLMPMTIAKSFNQQQQQQQHQHHQQQQQQLISYTSHTQQVSRSGSVTTSSNTIRPFTSADYMDLTNAQTYLSSGNSHVLMHGSESGSYLR